MLLLASGLLEPVLPLLANVCLESSGKQAQGQAQELSEMSAPLCCHLLWLPREAFLQFGSDVPLPAVSLRNVVITVH